MAPIHSFVFVVPVPSDRLAQQDMVVLNEQRASQMNRIVVQRAQRERPRVLSDCVWMRVANLAQ